MMERKQVNRILAKQVRLRKKKIRLSFFIFVMFFISIVLLMNFINRNKPQFIKYKEKSDLDYQVYLKENKYYKESFLSTDKEYIASLIDYIKADFNYNLMIEKENVNYQYNYRIEADVNVIEKSKKKNIYQHKDVLVEEELKKSYDSSEVNINESVNIDYNKYNDLIKGFVATYGLNEVESVLNINMYVSVSSECEDIKDTNNESVISLSIPLTTKTMSIDIKYDLVDENQEKIMICKNNSTCAVASIVMSGICLFIGICSIIKLANIIKSGRTAGTIYNRELKKILNNYKSYIQKVNYIANLENYSFFDVDTFIDMLEISDKINQPILMLESTKKDEVYFLIPNGFDKILYKYALKVSEIEKNIKGEK